MLIPTAQSRLNVNMAHPFQAIPSFIEIRSEYFEPGGRDLAIAITVAIGFYNSLHYRASRDFRGNDSVRRITDLSACL